MLESESRGAERPSDTRRFALVKRGPQRVVVGEVNRALRESDPPTVAA